MNLPFRFYAFALTVVALSGCASKGKPPPSILLDEPVQAQVLPQPPAPGRVTVVSLQPGEELVTIAAGDTVR